MRNSETAPQASADDTLRQLLTEQPQHTMRIPALPILVRNDMIHTLDEARAYARRAFSLPQDQKTTEVRIYATMLTVALELLLCEPIFYLLTVPEAPIVNVARLVEPSHWLVAWVYGLAALAVIPHLFSLCFLPGTLAVRWPRQCAGAAAYAACLMWIFLAWKAYPLDYGLLWAAYLVRALCSMSLAFAFGFSVNAQDLRDYAKAP